MVEVRVHSTTKKKLTNSVGYSLPEKELHSVILFLDGIPHEEHNTRTSAMYFQTLCTPVSTAIPKSSQMMENCCGTSGTYSENHVLHFFFGLLYICLTLVKQDGTSIFW